MAKDLYNSVYTITYNPLHYKEASQRDILYIHCVDTINFAKPF